MSIDIAEPRRAPTTPRWARPSRTARPGHLGVVLDHRPAHRRRRPGEHRPDRDRGRRRPAARSPRSTSSTPGPTGSPSTSPARRPTREHAEEIVEALRGVPGVTVHKVSDRTFLLHLGGKIEVALEGAAAAPATTCRWPTRPASGGSAWRWPSTRRTSPADDQGQHGRRGHRRLGRARARQHRAGRGAAGDGGQGRAVQAVRRHRRVADLPGHPGRRRDRAHRRADRARLRRHQPRGHLRAALLRDRAPAAREARHPGVPRRPARHGDRRAGRAEQRPARGRQAAGRRADRRRRRRRGRDGDRAPAAAAGVGTCWSGTARASSRPTTSG